MGCTEFTNSTDGLLHSHLICREIKNVLLLCRYDDPQNKTMGVIRLLLTEIASIFHDEPVMHMGGDETLPMGLCTSESIGGFYRKTLDIIQSLGKTPAGWQEVLWGSFGSHDNAPPAEIPPDTILQIALDTAGHFDSRPVSCGNVTKTGARCINSLVEHAYLDICGGASSLWYDVDVGVSSPSERHLVGGEVALWSQLWCPGAQTGAWGRLDVPQMFDSSKDLVFSESAMRWTWPRTAAAAGSFWHYDHTLEARGLVDRMSRFNDEVLRPRGVLTCPSGCHCTPKESCNISYL